MKNFFRKNVWMFASVAALAAILALFAFAEDYTLFKENVGENNTKVKGSDISRTIDEFQYKGKAYTFVIYERGVNTEVRELK